MARPKKDHRIKINVSGGIKYYQAYIKDRYVGTASEKKLCQIIAKHYNVVPEP